MKISNYPDLNLTINFDENEKLMYIHHNENVITLSFTEARDLTNDIKNNITEIILNEYKKDFKYEGSSL